MRKFAMVYPRFWFGSTGRLIMQQDHATKLVAIYLVTNPHATMIGLYLCPVRYIAADIGATEAEVETALGVLGRIGFAEYDFDQELVWVVNFARYQIPSRSPTVLKGCSNMLAALPRSPLVTAFHTEYASTLHLLDLPPNQSGEVARTGIREIREKRKEQKEKEQEQESIDTLSRPSPHPIDMVSSVQPLPESQADIQPVIDTWNEEMTHRAAEKNLAPHKNRQFGPLSKEWEEIRRRLGEGCTVEDLQDAVRGMFKTAFNNGETGRAYLSLQVAMKSTNISDFILKHREASAAPDDFDKWFREGV